LIVTVTPNPSFDRTLAVDSVQAGEVHRASSVTLEAGGKGINVAREKSRKESISRADRVFDPVCGCRSEENVGAIDEQCTVTSKADDDGFDTILLKLRRRVDDLRALRDWA